MAEAVAPRRLLDLAPGGALLAFVVGQWGPEGCGDLVLRDRPACPLGREAEQNHVREADPLGEALTAPLPPGDEAGQRCRVEGGQPRIGELPARDPEFGIRHDCDCGYPTAARGNRWRSARAKSR